MAYTNAIFYMDMVNGSDAARTALTTCIASNPSGSITRITKNAHGLVNGAVVTLSAFSAWLNGDWKIENVNLNYFDLVGATWQATADASGNVTPFGGSSKGFGSAGSDSWKTINGATAARIAAGDIVHIFQTENPLAIGNATFTEGNFNIELEAARTLEVDLCESGWAAAAGGDVSALAHNPINVVADCGKQGTNFLKITLDSSPQANKLQAYKTIAATNFSSCQRLSFWFKVSTGALNANNWKIKLCSDTAGVTEVDAFDVPASLLTPSASTGWHCFALDKIGGGNLGSSIQSIALYTGSVAPAANAVIGLDCIIATKTNDIDLTCFITRNGNAQGYSEPWYPINSIIGTNVYVDLMRYTYPTSNYAYGYATETPSASLEPVYIRRPVYVDNVATQTTAMFTITDSGTAGNYIQFKGGYDASDVQNGETFYATNAFCGRAVYMSGRSYLKFDRLCFGGVAIGYYGQSNCANIELVNILVTGANAPALFTGCNNIVLTNLVACETLNGFRFESSYILTIALYTAWSSGNGGGMSVSTSSYYIRATEIKILGADVQGLNYSDTYNVIINKITTQNVLGNVFYFGTCNYITMLEVICHGSNDTLFTFFGESGSGNIYIKTLTADSSFTSGLTGGLKNNQVEIESADVQDEPVDSRVSGVFYYMGRMKIHKYVADGFSRYYTTNAYVKQQTASAGGTGNEWLLFAESQRTISFPFEYPVARLYCNAGSNVTVKAFLKKSHATNIGASLIAKSLTCEGLSADAEQLCPDDTNRNEVSLVFNPTVAGVVEIYARIWYVSGLENVIVDGKVTATQA